MTRSVPEWKGKNDDQQPPDRVRVRVFVREDGKCHACGRRINGATERWTLEHRIALINGGENRESNLCCTCSFCLPAKNAADVAIKSDTYDMQRKHILQRKAKTRPMDGSRNSPWKRKMSGEVVRR